VVIRVPEEARLEFEGVAMPETGRIRKFVSPPLVPGQRYHYDIRATWEEDGRTVKRERRVTVYAGEKAEIDFLEPTEENRERQLHTQPIRPAPRKTAPKMPYPEPPKGFRGEYPEAPVGTTPAAPPRPAAPGPPRGKTPAVPPEEYLEEPPGMTPDVPPETKPGKPPVVPPLRPTLPPNRGS
jgi:uncharacterized protein (TIGR03000 family)